MRYASYVRSGRRLASATGPSRTICGRAEVTHPSRAGPRRAPDCPPRTRALPTCPVANLLNRTSTPAAPSISTATLAPAPDRSWAPHPSTRSNLVDLGLTGQRAIVVDTSHGIDLASALIHDRDSKFTATFDAMFDGADIRIIRTPVRAPQANDRRTLHRHPAPRMPQPSPDHWTAPPRGRD